MFQSNQRFQVIELMDQLPIPEKLNIFHSFLFYTWVSSHCDSYPQFPWPLLRMPGTMTPFWHVHTHTKRKKHLHFKNLAAKASETNKYTKIMKEANIQPT